MNQPNEYFNESEMVKDDKNEIIPLYITAIQELKEDLLNVQNEETKRLIQDEIGSCEKRMVFIQNL